MCAWPRSDRMCSLHIGCTASKRGSTALAHCRCSFVLMRDTHTALTRFSLAPLSPPSPLTCLGAIGCYEYKKTQRLSQAGVNLQMQQSWIPAGSCSQHPLLLEPLSLSILLSSLPHDFVNELIHELVTSTYSFSNRHTVALILALPSFPLSTNSSRTRPHELVT